MNNNRREYYHSLLGKSVWIKFMSDNCQDGEESYYRGKIVTLREETTYKGKYTATHFIKFDDGDEGWENIDELEKEDDLLLWEPPSSKSSSESTRTEKKQKKSKKQQQKRKKDADCIKEEDEEKHQGNNRKKRVKTEDDYEDDDDSNNHNGVSDTKEEDPTEDGDEIGSDVKVAMKYEEADDDEDEGNSDDMNMASNKAFHSINHNDAKQWIGQLGLEYAYGREESGLDMIKVKSVAYVPPCSFESLFILTDFLFPGNEYHCRLFKGQARPGIIIRQILRDKLKEDPTNSFLSWHQARQPWIPPK